MKKFVSTLLAIIIVINLFLLPVYAEPELETPEEPDVIFELNNGVYNNVSFAITNTGYSEVDISYTGRSGYFFRVEITTYLQKKILGLFWTKVDIGEPNNEWFDASFVLSDIFIHNYQLSSKGTYRAVVEVRFIGTGGPDDVLTHKLEAIYS